MRPNGQRAAILTAVCATGHIRLREAGERMHASICAASNGGLAVNQLLPVGPRRSCLNEESRSRLASCQPNAAVWYQVRTWGSRHALPLTGPFPSWESIAVLNRIPGVNVLMEGLLFRFAVRQSLAIHRLTMVSN